MVAITQTSLGGTTAEDAELQNAEAASKPTASDWPKMLIGFGMSTDARKLPGF